MHKNIISLMTAAFMTAVIPAFAVLPVCADGIPTINITPGKSGYISIDGKKYLDSSPEFDISVRGYDEESKATILLNNNIIYQENLHIAKIDADRWLKRLNVSDLGIREGENRIETVLKTEKREFVVSEVFNIDRQSPNITGVYLADKKLNFMNSIGKIELSSPGEMILQVDAKDSVSGVKEIIAEYYDENDKAIDTEIIPYKSNCKVKIKSGFKGYLRLQAVDYMGLKSVKRLLPGIITGQTSKNESSSATNTPDTPKETLGNLKVSLSLEGGEIGKNTLFKGPVKVKLVAMDDKAGIANVTWHRIDNPAISGSFSAKNKTWGTKISSGLVTEAYKTILVPDEGNGIGIIAKVTNNLKETREEKILFNIDLSNPMVQISGVSDKSANNGDVFPVIAITDNNIDLEGCQVSISRADKGVVDWQYETTDTKISRTFKFHNIASVKKNDGLYSLIVTGRDLAGNKVRREIAFSINRFGSAYSLGKQAMDMIGKYNRLPADIVLTETNVDVINPEDILVKMSFDGKLRILKAGVDYSVKNISSKNGWNSYEYRIPSKLFSKDGSYRLDFSSVDAAGNHNETLKEKNIADIDFGIDTTAPVIKAINLSSGYQLESKEYDAKFIVDDNVSIGDVKMYINGKKTEYIQNGNEYRLKLNGDTEKYEIEIEAKDKAGNTVKEKIGDITVEEKSILPVSVGGVEWKPNFNVPKALITGNEGSGEVVSEEETLPIVLIMASVVLAITVAVLLFVIIRKGKIYEKN